LVRVRGSFGFAVAWAAVSLDLDGSRIRDARVGLGGVATKPWRSKEAEQMLIGQPATLENFRKAAEAALASAKVQPDNKFKVELAKRTLVRALSEIGGTR
jgi:xanthine dehydrogenase YagS FAD-binding subunit